MIGGDRYNGKQSIQHHTIREQPHRLDVQQRAPINRYDDLLNIEPSNSNRIKGVSALNCIADRHEHLLFCCVGEGRRMRRKRRKRRMSTVFEIGFFIRPAPPITWHHLLTNGPKGRQGCRLLSKLVDPPICFAN